MVAAAGGCHGSEANTTAFSKVLRSARASVQTCSCPKKTVTNEASITIFTDVASFGSSSRSGSHPALPSLP